MDAFLRIALLDPLRWLYVNAPSVGGLGGHEGLEPAEICARLTNVPTRHWQDAGAASCDLLIDRKVRAVATTLLVLQSQALLPSWDGGGPVAASASDYTQLAPILVGPAPQYVPPQISPADPAIDKTVSFPVTVGDLRDRVRTAGRIDPDIKTRRMKIPAILVNQGNRILDPSNNMYYASTLRTAYYLPNDFAQDTKRLNPGFISPHSYPRSN
ncbi:hypothetical protein WJX74_005668 [Apatococcus lobatus]|uniref:Uncharacterized protein n=1 Tax=Apatococcus lobatus TaxID=904363 RepID=A0AAW1R007_9CHLO